MANGLRWPLMDYTESTVRCVSSSQEIDAPPSNCASMAEEADTSFRALQAEDLPLLFTWLGQPHVTELWGRKASSLEELADKYLPRIAGRIPTRCYLILLNSLPIGYIQSYRITDHPRYAACLNLERAIGICGVDLFLGNPDMLYEGIGSAALRQFLRGHIFGDPQIEGCVLGPPPGNAAAIRAYEKVGFRYLKTVHCPDEPAPEYVMQVTRDTIMRAA